MCIRPCRYCPSSLSRILLSSFISSKASALQLCMLANTDAFTAYLLCTYALNGGFNLNQYDGRENSQCNLISSYSFLLTLWVREMHLEFKALMPWGHLHVICISIYINITAMLKIGGQLTLEVFTIVRFHVTRCNFKR